MQVLFNASFLLARTLFLVTFADLLPITQRMRLYTCLSLCLPVALIYSSYVGDPHGNDPICAVETATADQTAAHFAPHREVLPAGEGHAAASPLHGPQPVSSRHPPERLAEQVPNHVGIIPLTSPPYHSLQSIQSLPHLHEPYHAPTVATIVSNGDVYSQLNCKLLVCVAKSVQVYRSV